MQIKDYNGKELNIGDKCLVASSETQGAGKKYKFAERYITRVTDSMIHFNDTPVYKREWLQIKVAKTWASNCIIKL
jgi:hypothetical protein